MPLARVLLVVSAQLLAATGLGYLFVPAAMLSVVGIAGSPTEVFLIRTEGVALVTAAALTETARRAAGPSGWPSSSWRSTWSWVR